MGLCRQPCTQHSLLSPSHSSHHGEISHSRGTSSVRIKALHNTCFKISFPFFKIVSKLVQSFLSRKHRRDEQCVSKLHSPQFSRSRGHQEVLIDLPLSQRSHSPSPPDPGQTSCARAGPDPLPYQTCPEQGIPPVPSSAGSPENPWQQFCWCWGHPQSPLALLQGQHCVFLCCNI